MKNPTIIRTIVSTRTEQDLIRRHQAALNQMERLDISRELRRPALVNEILRRDAIDWDAQVIQAMARQADPLTGPRTATHPMAVPISKEMATRIRPHLHEPHEPRNPIYYRPVFWGAVDLTIIAAVVAFAWWLA
jgi:hypothetical protein